jgi:hypothetical protein
MTTNTRNPRSKVEALTANYPISVALDARSKKELVGMEAAE